VTDEIADMVRSSTIKLVCLGEKPLKNVTGTHKIGTVSENGLPVPAKFIDEEIPKTPNNLLLLFLDQHHNQRE